MKLNKVCAALAACGLAFGMSAASAQKLSGDKITIGFITDLSSLYSDLDGPAGVEAIRMAIADMQKEFPGKKIEVLSADHQNKADISSSKVREWIDQGGADMIIGGTNSAAQLAAAKVATEKKRPFIVSGAATSRLTNEDCSPYIVHYTYDTIALANGTGSAVVKSGGKSWFFLTADYAFGHSLEKDTAEVVKAAGGTVVGQVRHPLSASDFSSFLLQAQNSKAQILGLANAGGDTINSIKAANEFGITKNMKLAGLLMFINDIHALGLADYAGHVPDRRLVLEPVARVARVGPQVLHEVQAHAVDDSGGQLLGDHAVSDRRQSRRHRRCRCGDGAAEKTEDQRHVRQGRLYPSRWPHGPRDVSDAGENAGRVKRAVGLFQGRTDDPGRTGVSVARKFEVLIGHKKISSGRAAHAARLF